jgi:hypothetical protein
MQNGHHLNKYTVRVKTEVSIGTGIIVTDTGLILTCYHVVGDVKNAFFEDIEIYFPEAEKTTKAVQVIKEYCSPDLDIAFLEIREKLPEQSAVAPLGEEVVDGHEFASVGFRKADQFGKPLGTRGRIQVITSLKGNDDEKSVAPRLIQLYSDQIEEGMSGAAVLDVETDKVIGIISLHHPSNTVVDAKLNFAIPVSSILEGSKATSLLKKRNVGLSKFNNFIELIGKRGSFVHERFEDVYVPPIEYEEIEKNLKEFKCVFITGSPEYGKTYTSINLLWEYYKNDNHYIPMYVEEGSKDSTDIIRKLSELNEIIKHHIIYFEDPLGKTEYKSNKEFEESIDSIIDGLRTLDVYLIVTMREEIFQKFNPTGEIDPKKYVKKLNIGNNSYNFEKRKEMLLRWATVMKCTWLQDENSKNELLEAMRYEIILPTPLNIKDFAMATASHNVIEEKELLEILYSKSQRTPTRFAREIEEMKEHEEIDKILLLCFLFISEQFSVDFVKVEYDKLLAVFGIKNGYTFERARIKLQDKIELSNYIGFSHPSYSEALRYLLLEDGIPTEINSEFFSKVLMNLSDNKDAASNVASAVAANFTELPENVQNLLFKLADNKETSSYVASAIAWYFDNVPVNVRNELLIKLADNKDAASNVASAVAANFAKLPENVQNLLFKLADNKDAASGVAYGVGQNFDNLPVNVRNELLIKLADKHVGDVAYALAVNFAKLPENVQNLLFKLADNRDTALYVGFTVKADFTKLPENVRNQLLIKLADDEFEAAYVASVVANNFSKLPENVRNQLLIKLTRYATYPTYFAASAVQDLLSKLADNKDAATSIAYAIICNFDKVPVNVRNLLIKLAENENVQNLLFKLADNKETVMDVAGLLPNPVSNIV